MDEVLSGQLVLLALVAFGSYLVFLDGGVTQAALEAAAQRGCKMTDQAMSFVWDDLTDARAMAQARRAELVLSDKRAAADELRTDCASYADALAALQRARLHAVRFARV